MLNEVSIEGIVARDTWKYDKDLFFRLACYRDSDLPPKPDTDKEVPDYINIRVPGGAGGLLALRKGMRVRVHGFLQSRDYQESLDEYLEKAAKLGEVPTLENVDLKKIRIDRNIVEVVAARLILLDKTDK